MKWLISMLFFAALVADAYIYKGFVAKRRRHFGVRAAYVVFAALTDGAALTALTLYGAAADVGTEGVIAVMWCVWVFFVTLVPKILFALLRWPGLAVAAAVMAAMVAGATAGRTKLRVEEVEVCSRRVPAAFDGYRIVQFSDLHLGTMMRPEKQIARVVEAINAQRGDVIVNTGDVVNLVHGELTPGVMELLARLEARDGVWNVWGNHDLGFYIREGAAVSPEKNLEALAEKLRSMGWRVLSDDSEWIRREGPGAGKVGGEGGGDSILLTGLDYPRDSTLNGHNESLAGVDIAAAFEEVEREGRGGRGGSGGGEGRGGRERGDPFNVVLAHTPKLWEQITARGKGGDVTLAGHVHAMQMKVRLGRGKRWSPAQWMYDRWSGVYTAGEDENGKKKVLYVNDGIGCVGYPMRIGARGEITVITLKRCE